MKHRMAVWAHRAQVFNGVYFIPFANLRQFLQMMHMNELFSNIAVGFGKIKLADGALGTVTSNAFSTHLRVALISIDRNLLLRAFRVMSGSTELFGKYAFLGHYNAIIL